MSSAQYDVDQEEDPLNELGFGFTAYFDMLWTLTWVFFVMSLIMIPVFYLCINA